MIVDVVILGDGITGQCLGSLLSKKGLRVGIVQVDDHLLEEQRKLKEESLTASLSCFRSIFNPLEEIVGISPVVKKCKVSFQDYKQEQDQERVHVQKQDYRQEQKHEQEHEQKEDNEQEHEQNQWKELTVKQSKSQSDEQYSNRVREYPCELHSLFYQLMQEYPLESESLKLLYNKLVRGYKILQKGFPRYVEENKRGEISFHYKKRQMLHSYFYRSFYQVNALAFMKQYISDTVIKIIEQVVEQSLDLSIESISLSQFIEYFVGRQVGGCYHFSHGDDYFVGKLEKVNEENGTIYYSKKKLQKLCINYNKVYGIQFKNGDGLYASVILSTLNTEGLRYLFRHEECHLAEDMIDKESNLFHGKIGELELQDIFLYNKENMPLRGFYHCSLRNNQIEKNPRYHVKLMFIINSILHRFQMEVIDRLKKDVNFVRVIAKEEEESFWYQEYDEVSRAIFVNASRCMNCKHPTCNKGITLRIPEIIRKTANENYIGALKMIQEYTKFHDITEHLLDCCEKKCVFHESGSEPVMIKTIIMEIMKRESYVRKKRKEFLRRSRKELIKDK